MAANNDSQCDVCSLQFCKANEIYHLSQRWLHSDHYILDFSQSCHLLTMRIAKGSYRHNYFIVNLCSKVYRFHCQVPAIQPFFKYLFVYCLRFKKNWSCFSKFILYEQMADNFEAEAKNLRDQLLVTILLQRLLTHLVQGLLKTWDLQSNIYLVECN